MAENLYTIPLSNIPQDFDIVLAGVQFRMTCKWSEYQGWVLDLYNGVDQSALIMNIPLVVGCDLLEQYRYTGILGSLVVYTDGDQYEMPTLDNLGTESNVYYLVSA